MPDAGQGVFASRDIDKGELITLYPADAVLYWPDADRESGGKAELIWGSAVPQSERSEALRTELLTHRQFPTGGPAAAYEIMTGESTSAIGNPAWCHDRAYMGHMINDGAFLSSPSNRVEYETLSAARQNAEIFGCEGAFVDGQRNAFKGAPWYGVRALVPIPQGSEVLVSYGARYWVSQYLARSFAGPGDVSSTELQESSMPNPAGGGFGGGQAVRRGKGRKNGLQKK